MASCPYRLNEGFDSLGLYAAAWDPATNQYFVTPRSPADTFVRGQGYWVFTALAVSIQDQGTQSSTASSSPIVLQPGWNMIGNPFAQPVHLSDVVVVDPAGTVSPLASVMAEFPVPIAYRFDPVSGTYAAVTAGDTLSPWDAIWIYSLSTVSLIIPNPLAQATGSLGGTAPNGGVQPPVEDLDAALRFASLPLDPALGVSIDAGAHRLYIAGFTPGIGQSYLRVLDSDSLSILATIPILDGASGSILTSSNGRVYISGAKLTVLDGQQGLVLAVIPVACYGLAGAINEATNTVYMPDRNGFLNVIDGSTNAIVSQIQIGATRNCRAAVNPLTNRVYVTTDTGLEVIDGASNTVVTTLPSLSSAAGVAVNPRQNLVYVQGSDRLGVLDGATNEVIRTVLYSGSGGSIGPVIFDASSNRLVLEYGADSGQPIIHSRVTVLDGTSLLTTASFPSGPPGTYAFGSGSLMIEDTTGFAFDPTTNRVFVTNWGGPSLRVFTIPS